MKRKICIIATLVMTVLSTMNINAEIIKYKTYNGFKYKVDGKEINYYVGKKTTASIPSKIDGEKVRDVFFV